jgi:hypothetical protein
MTKDPKQMTDDPTNEKPTSASPAAGGYADEMLERLMGEVEDAYESGDGFDRAHDLGQDHPEYAAELLDFYETLVNAPDMPLPDTYTMLRSTVLLIDRLEEEGMHSMAEVIREQAKRKAA